MPEVRQMKLLLILIIIAAIVVFAFSQQSPQEKAVQTPRIIPDVPRDAIPPLFFPEYVSPQESGVKDEDFILGFEQNGDARAYPLKILNFHEIVNDEIGGEKVVVTYCPLCRSGIVFSRILDGLELSFGNTGALYESALVMYDKETESYWAQIGGEAIKGELTGKKLKVLPSNTLTFGEWKSLHPDTKVLTQDLGFGRNYDLDPYKGFDRPELPPGWPVSHEDDRLLPREKILGIQVDSSFKAYSLTRLKHAVVNDEFKGKGLVVFSTATESGFVYEREVDEKELEFELVDNSIRDTQTRSEWDLSGKAIAGELAGTQLIPYPSVAAFWFSWFTIHPETDLFQA